jgi:hypothetical protein
MLWMSRFVPFVLFVLRKTARREESARPYDGPGQSGRAQAVVKKWN